MIYFKRECHTPLLQSKIFLNVCQLWLMFLFMQKMDNLVSSIRGDSTMKSSSRIADNEKVRPAPQQQGCRIEGFVWVKKVTLLWTWKHGKTIHENQYMRTHIYTHRETLYMGYKLKKETNVAQSLRTTVSFVHVILNSYEIIPDVGSRKSGHLSSVRITLIWCFTDEHVTCDLNLLFWVLNYSNDDE